MYQNRPLSSQMSVLVVYSKSNVSKLRRQLYTKLTGKDGSSTDLDDQVNGLMWYRP